MKIPTPNDSAIPTPARLHSSRIFDCLRSQLIAKTLQVAQSVAAKPEPVAIAQPVDPFGTSGYSIASQSTWPAKTRAQPMMNWWRKVMVNCDGDMESGYPKAVSRERQFLVDSTSSHRLAMSPQLPLDPPLHHILQHLQRHIACQQHDVVELLDVELVA